MNSNPKTALFVSPHLDDAAFSCGGTLIKLASEDWRVILCTIFTASVQRPQGFALSCQTDKGLSPEADYMELRRAEDFEFAQFTNVSELIHLDFAEAPHRNYQSATELFAGIKTDDKIWQRVKIKLGEINDKFAPDLIFAPAGIGNHIDHLQTIQAILESNFAAQTVWYQDTPYVVRHKNALPSSQLNNLNLRLQPLDISGTIEQKILAANLYRTQINFQFGGAENLAIVLREFHLADNAKNFYEYFFSAESIESNRED